MTIHPRDAVGLYRLLHGEASPEVRVELRRSFLVPGRGLHVESPLFPARRGEAHVEITRALMAPTESGFVLAGPSSLGDLGFVFRYPTNREELPPGPSLGHVRTLPILFPGAAPELWLTEEGEPAAAVAYPEGSDGSGEAWAQARAVGAELLAKPNLEWIASTALPGGVLFYDRRWRPRPPQD